MKKIVLSTVVLMGYSQLLWSQENSEVREPMSEFQKAIALYNRKMYQPAQNLFHKTQAEHPDKAVKAQSEYCIATIAALLNQKGADALVNNFILNHPESPLNSAAYVQMAHLYFQQGSYAESLEWYNAIDPLSLKGEGKDRYYFEKGYALFNTGKQNESKPYFGTIQQHRECRADAKYYLGYIAYDTNDYAKAENYFRQVNTEDSVNNNVSYFQANIYFSQTLYEEAIEKDEKQLKKTKNAQEVSELNKIIDESYFDLKKYKEAIPYLQNCKGKKGKFSNTDYYYIGYALYENNDYNGAIAQFNRIIDGNDQVAQNAYYHLAECYLKTGQKRQALNAFRNASQMDFNAQIEKDAHLNYARLEYEIGNPYESVPSVLQAYATAYPNDHKGEIQGLLVDSYISSGNYQAAISLLERSSDPKDRELYKKIAFYRGVELFNELQCADALTYLDKAVADNSAIAARAAYWAAEAAYQLKNYPKAATYFQQFFANPSASKTDECPKAFYGLAYANFNQRHYAEAIVNFKKYLKQNPKDEDFKHDAMLRLADSYFVTGKYWPAMEGYNKLIESKSTGQDYAAYQKAISYGFVDRPNNKIEDLERFIRNYPTSNLRPNALYELGNTYVTQRDADKGLQYYQQLAKDCKGNALMPRAMLREGLVYYDRDENQKALSLFKAIAKDYPKTTEASQAVSSAELIYVNMGQVNDYAAWAKSLGYVGVTDLELESATYEAAERQLLQNNNKEAIMAFEKYLQQLPNGIHRTNAEFYLTQALYNTGKEAEALTHYENVTKAGSSEFGEPSLTHVCQILLDAGSYLKAKPYLEELEGTATIAQNKTYAQSDLMRVCYNEKLYDKAIEYANKVLSEKSIDTRIKNNAYIVLAHAYTQGGSEAQTRKYYQEVQKTATGSLAAEAMYYEAFYKNKDKDYKGSNDIVQHITKDYDGHKEWATKSLIVMARSFNGLKDAYQASYILESVARNFREYPEVVAEAKKELTNVKAEAAKNNSSVK